MYERIHFLCSFIPLYPYSCYLPWDRYTLPYYTLPIYSLYVRNVRLLRTVGKSRLPMLFMRERVMLSRMYCKKIVGIVKSF